jgi:hypothetical protein
MRTYAPWPYAVGAFLQHEFDTDHLNIWLTFSERMNIKLKPADTKWIVKCDGVTKLVTASAWQDRFTMLLTVSEVSADPDRVTVQYDGPSTLLRICQNKQWEPWGPMLSRDITT